MTGLVSHAGGILNGVLLRSGLVDEIDIQFLPVVRLDELLVVGVAACLAKA